MVDRHVRSPAGMLGFPGWLRVGGAGDLDVDLSRRLPIVAHMDNILWHPFVFGFVLYPLAVLMTIPFMSQNTSPVLVVGVPVALAAVLASAPEMASARKRLVSGR